MLIFHCYLLKQTKENTTDKKIYRFYLDKKDAVVCIKLMGYSTDVAYNGC